MHLLNNLHLYFLWETNDFFRGTPCSWNLRILNTDPLESIPKAVTTSLWVQRDNVAFLGATYFIYKTATSLALSTSQDCSADKTVQECNYIFIYPCGYKHTYIYFTIFPRFGGSCEGQFIKLNCPTLKLAHKSKKGQIYK